MPYSVIKNPSQEESHEKTYCTFITERTKEHQKLKQFISSGKRTAQLFTLARILLKADQGKKGPGWSGEKISQALDVTVQTVKRIRKQLVQEGSDAVLKRQQYIQKASHKRLDGDAEAHIITL